MTELIRVKSRWSGFAGGPGYTVLHYRDFGSGDGGGGAVTAQAATDAIARTSQFFSTLKAQFPAEVRVQVESDVDVVEDTNGELVRTVTGTAVPVIAGTGTGPYSAAVGAVVNWRTGGVRKGRRVRGRSFIVPLVGSAFGTTGQLTPTVQTLFQNAAQNLIDAAGAPDLAVYARPSGPGASDGGAFIVTGTNVPTLGAVLRSRRD